MSTFPLCSIWLTIDAFFKLQPSTLIQLKWKGIALMFSVKADASTSFPA